MSVLENLNGIFNMDRPVTELDVDTVFHLLSNERRRWAVEYLAENDGATDLRDMAQAMAFIESDGYATPEAVPRNLYKAAYVSLYQTHLPKLESAGVIDVSRAGNVRGLQPIEGLATICREVRQMSDGGGDR